MGPIPTGLQTVIYTNLTSLQQGSLCSYTHHRPGCCYDLEEARGREDIIVFHGFNLHLPHMETVSPLTGKTQLGLIVMELNRVSNHAYSLFLSFLYLPSCHSSSSLTSTCDWELPIFSVCKGILVSLEGRALDKKPKKKRNSILTRQERRVSCSPCLQKAREGLPWCSRG